MDNQRTHKTKNTSEEMFFGEKKLLSYKSVKLNLLKIYG